MAPDPAVSDQKSNISLDLIFEPVGSLNDSSRFYRGDVAVLAATVTNKTDIAISGKLSIYDPVQNYAFSYQLHLTFTFLIALVFFSRS